MSYHLYPILFQPNLHEVVWGGSRLAPWKQLGTQTQIGESWEVSAVPSSPSLVANGEYAGMPLTEVIARMPQEILGQKVAEKYGNQLPLLVKFIDADKDLSIQVHPNDEMAMREHGKMGKTEMWYIIDAKPGAFLYAGFKEAISPYEYAKRVEDGTITEVLARHEVHTGDVFYLPAGRVHAIGGGILLAEVQQSSDVTYRIFDYNRPGIDGKPRQLHTALAAKAIDYKVYDEYRTIYDTDNSPFKGTGGSARHCIDSEYFNVRVVDIDRPFHRNLIKYDSFIISMCIKGTCKIRIRSTHDEVILHEGNSCLIPAAIADYDIEPIASPAEGSLEVPAPCLLLDAFINNKDMSLTSMFTRFLHITQK